jgi:hypothetical protein
MNLYGWSVEAFKSVLGSKDSAVLKSAMGHLSESLEDEDVLARAKAWLRTLIESGHPLRQALSP